MHVIAFFNSKRLLTFCHTFLKYPEAVHFENIYFEKRKTLQFLFTYDYIMPTKIETWHPKKKHF